MKRLWWAIIIIALIIYSVIVWGWIQEGNRHFNAPVNKQGTLQ